MRNGDKVLLRIRGKSRSSETTDPPWQEDVLFATYHPTPFGCESAHFHGQFLVDDDACQWDEVDVLTAHGAD